MRSALVTAALLAMLCAPAHACGFGTIPAPSLNYNSGKQTSNVYTFTQVTLSSCTNGAVITLSIDMGQHASSFSPRYAASGSNLMAYNYYTTQTYTTIVGDGTGGTSTISLTYNNGGTYTFIFAALANQNPPAGTYTDTVGITITF